MIWFTSDLHLGHSAVIGFCKRPFADAKEMDAHLTERWRRSVRTEDIVYVLGDICFHKPSIGVPILQGLPGLKILVRGNHDGYSDTQYRAAGFVAILEEAKINLYGERVRLSHYPYWEEVPASDSSYEPRYPERRPHNAGGFLLCGHVHEKWQTRGRMINVGVDQWEYGPVSSRTIDSLIRRTRNAEAAP